MKDIKYIYKYNKKRTIKVDIQTHKSKKKITSLQKLDPVLLILVYVHIKQITQM